MLRSEQRSDLKLQIIPLGGLGEIGKNMTVIRCGDEMILIDAGLMFPENDMLGVDLVIPDISYILENEQCLKAIFLTHGHEDHIGALPYILKELSVPVYGTRLTLGILEGRLKENGVDSGNLRVVTPGEIVTLGCFSIGFIRVRIEVCPENIDPSIRSPIDHNVDESLDLLVIGSSEHLAEFSDFILVVADVI